MISRTKYAIDPKTVGTLFRAAGLGAAESVAELGAGEFNAVFSVRANGKDYALKIAPSGEIPVMTYEKDMMQSEVYWYGQIREHTSIRVPEIYAQDFTGQHIPTQYFIMEKLPGQPLDQIKLPPAQKAASATITAKMAAQIHRIQNDRFGYIQNELYDTWYLAIRAMVTAVLQDCAQQGKRSKNGEQLLRYIDRYKDVLEQAECRMVNFDIHAGNILAQTDQGALHYAWIDPERSYWGDPVADFVMLEMMKPLEKKTTSLAAYNAEAQLPLALTKEVHIRYAIAQAYLGLIMETEKYYRYSRKNFGWWRNVGATALLYPQAFQVLRRG